MTPIKQKFIEQIHKEYPGITADLDALIYDNILSVFVVQLPKSILQKAQEIVRSYFELRENPSYQKFLNEKIQTHQLQDPGNKSILMSYDFHLNAQNELKLIEVNTNAAFLVLGDLLYKAQGLAQPVEDFKIQEIAENILEELRLQNKTLQKPRIAIIDDKPQEQRLFIEFLIYQKLFSQLGYPAEIIDVNELNKNNFNYDFIYNRYTDFLLREPKSQFLREAFLKKQICLSPHPYEYLLLADKERMELWSDENIMNQLSLPEKTKNCILSSCPKTVELRADNKDELWTQKKNLFIKPKNSFGSKQTYKAGSMSRNLFEKLVGQNFIAQEFIPASTQKFSDIEFKMDLRCYAYKGRLQSVIARLYQGQVTNTQTPMGGFACVKFYE